MTPVLFETVSDRTADAPRDRKIDFRNHRELLESNLQRQIEAGRAADIKIALLVPTTTAMLGVLAALLRDKVLEPGQMGMAAAFAAPLLLAYALMAAGVIPRLRSTSSKSLLFFGDLSAQEAHAAQNGLLTITPQAYLADVAAQCHITAGIAQTKHRAVRRAYLAFLVALPFWLVSIWMLNGR